MKRLPIHYKILIGLVLGISWSLLSQRFGFTEFTSDWVSPFGSIFINSLKLIAVPLVLVSLIDGISNLTDISKLSRIGGKTIGLYLISTVLAITVGLIAVNIIDPGSYVSEEKSAELKEAYASDVDVYIARASDEKEHGPLQVLVDIVPDNIFLSLTNNGLMLQVIFFAFLFGIAMIITTPEKTKPLKNFFDSANAILIRVVEIIMKFAPYGVFALLAGLNLDGSLFKALGAYVGTVLFSLAFMIFIFYPVLISIFTKIKIPDFFRSILPAQLLAFSTSSSAATLPVTMECVEKNIGVSEEVSSFVLPLGATINMDGTSIHQAVSAVFIATAFGYDLSLTQQLIIIITATLSSIGAAAVPSAGLVMLVIVLSAIGIDPAGMVLIIAMDRPLDMCRTIVNVTGDSTVATLVATSEGEKIGEPANMS